MQAVQRPHTHCLLLQRGARWQNFEKGTEETLLARTAGSVNATKVECAANFPVASQIMNRPKPQGNRGRVTKRGRHRQRRELAIVSATGKPGLSASLVVPQARHQGTNVDAVRKIVSLDSGTSAPDGPSRPEDA
jgi:hypothetical protein